MLKKRKWRNQALEVSAMRLDCIGISQSYGTSKEKEAIAIIHRATELSMTFF